MILEALVFKGLLVAGKFIASKGLAIKVGLLIKSIIVSHGVAAAITGAITVGAVIGGVIWTKERIDMAGDLIKGISEGDGGKAATAFIGLLDSTNLGIDSLVCSLDSFVHNGCSSKEDAKRIIYGIREIAEVIKNA